MKDELLMRAAQANGHAYPWTMPNGFGERPWNPLTNNEDALVLAVRIGLQVTAYPMYDEPKHSVIVRKPVWDHDAQEGDGVEVIEPYGTDALAATRRAITMCAAELARRKTPNRQLSARRRRPLERTVRPCNHTDERSEMMTRHCDDCGHTGDEGGSTTESYCGSCGATVPYPKEDKCQECGATNCMLIACPKCGGQYWEHEQQEEAQQTAKRAPKASA